MTWNNWHKEICILRYKTESFLSKTKRRIWNKHLLLWWYQLWIRKDEFHKSLDMDPDAVIEMNKKETKQYFANLTGRRKKAHQKGV